MYDTIRCFADAPTTTAILTIMEQGDGSSTPEEAAAWKLLAAIPATEWAALRRQLRDASLHAAATWIQEYRDAQ